ncbi:hypothetical protein ABZU25_01495 [Micromonospora sp. NPDC005215]|uniref:hypothetical protein n=1 Tax=unclassified Micromonospora TaxID=2617518 RepID=UPI0033A0555D
MDTILATVEHKCGGDQIPTEELGWYCTCDQPECRRRQQGMWAPGTKPGGNRK